MIPAALSFVDGLALDVAAQNRTANEALCLLRSRGLTADREALAEAVAAVQLRDVFLARGGNPYEFVGVEPRIGVRAWDLAVQLCEDQLESHLRVLASPAAVAA